MGFCTGIPAASCLYEDLTTSCTKTSTYYDTPVPESVLASIHSSNSCTWLEGIIARNYTTQDVWRDLLPANIYEPNSTNCYGKQYMSYFNLSIDGDKEYSGKRDWLIPCGLASLTGPCIVKACRGAGTTGDPDMAGVGVLVAYIFEAFFTTAFYLSQLMGSCTKGDKEYDDANSGCQCFAATTHKFAGAGGAGECGCSVVANHSNTLHERRRSLVGTHIQAMRDTTPLFLDTAVFFALSVAIGVVATASSSSVPKYESKVLGYVSLLAIFPLYTVLAFSSRTLRRKKFRSCLISLAVIPLCYGTILVVVKSSRVRDKWGMVCFVYNIKFLVPRAKVTSFIAFITCCCECFRFLEAVGAVRRCIEQWGKLSCWQWALGFYKRYISSWTSQERSTWVAATCSLGLTLHALGSLVEYRGLVQGLAGESYKESEMTYGQCLAAFIWLPVLAEYGYHMMYGTRKALEGRLPTHYTIARPPRAAGVGNPGDVGGGRSGGELGLEQTSEAKSGQILHPDLGGVCDRRHANPV